MPLSSFFLAWAQLSFNRVKLVVATAGVVVAVMLMLVQLGIRQGAMDNSVSIARRITADLVLVSPRTKTIFASATFPRVLLYRASSVQGVADVGEMYMAQGRFRNPWDKLEFPVSLYGINPRAPMMDLDGLERFVDELELPDRILFDALSRKNYGPVADILKEKGELDVEVNLRKVTIIDSINVGISINTDGNLYMSPSNFLRLFPERNPGAVDVGLIKVAKGADVQTVKRSIEPLIGHEAKVLTRDELVEKEIAFIRENAPIDFIFGMGAAVGFFVGFVVVYQILYTEVTNHLPQYATLKAMGFSDQYLLRVVFSQALMLSVLGYLPGFVLALWLYRVATNAIQMQFSMTAERALFVFALTIVMCVLSAVMAIGKVRSADPAEVF
ncbi:MAG: FtsX-like permease family protein [Planctomycetaceae bacterium]|nr:FtsX-like permease family protein [Planctomycetaceae bacterium]